MYVFQPAGVSNLPGVVYKEARRGAEDGMCWHSGRVTRQDPCSDTLTCDTSKISSWMSVTRCLSSSVSKHALRFICLFIYFYFFLGGGGGSFPSGPSTELL